ncbi:Glycosyltransferase involved in cell wall bisynthesis [Desulfocicer vacuolatum DSM 3385]|uniref:Glycosyltransferase involved in cell wall bisynthesis n=1 Tax=Desulfocicer vacuolatum DSM 3385 TaxID=1121400 RepID=A0A1W2BUP1_9BACT|nr:glycosyltransferase [Desulfocicer vacuolatum]SMC76591.1 Glycosyltransferase involved in cell wall bisynthesis [Desulfocicer vacuolatum DSM 3385]
MKPKAIHQFHSGSAVGDAVTNSMIFIQEMLSQLGFTSQIFVENPAPGLEKKLLHYQQLSSNANDIIFIHHSMGHELTDWIESLPGKKILIYHNITPARFFPEDSPFHHYSRIGRQQLRTFLPLMDAAIAVSKTNKEELESLGYKNVTQIPLLMDTEILEQRPWDENIVTNNADIFTILFVGRVAPNKCQQDLISIANRLKNCFHRPFQLVMIGNCDTHCPYYKSLMENIMAAGMEEHIHFTGKIPDNELFGWYRAADLFLCMSEHEGFGVPLIEAMAFNLPVVAFKSSNIPHTMDGAGILVTQKDPSAIAALIKIISTDKALKRAIIKKQKKHVEHFKKHRLIKQLKLFLQKQKIAIPSVTESRSVYNKKPHYQIEGPFETSYSLAVVNRELGFSLNRSTPGSVGLFATEGPGDYRPDKKLINGIPGLKTLWQKGKKGSQANVIIRNLYPPRVSDMDGEINLLYFAWEESGLSQQWVTQFNRHLDGLPVLSEFIKKTLIDNGVSLPITAAGCGMDHIHKEPVIPCPLANQSGFKFLHISSCFPRKGIDILLKAFAGTFTLKDDVALVIKTFPNEHNTIESQVQKIKQRFPGCPPIEIINKDLPPGKIVDLYRQCHALVAPSRGEGFGLPMAEAMWYELPVITTGHGGQMDFCTPETSWLIDFTFQSAQSHMQLFNSVWAEPDEGHLGRLMKQVRNTPKKELQTKLFNAKEIIEGKFTWNHCAKRLQKLEKYIEQAPPLQEKRYLIGWLSSWNTRCGIATYSKFLMDSLDMEIFEPHIFASYSSGDAGYKNTSMTKCWQDHTDQGKELLAALKEKKPDIIIIQFNFGFFNIETLKQIIEFAQEQQLLSIIFFHATKDVNKPDFKASLSTIRTSLAKVDRLLVHGVEDLNRLKSWGLYQNTAIFPHGLQKAPFLPQDDAKKLAQIPHHKIVIASYGFMLPHKGLEALLEAFSILINKHKNLHLLMLNALYPVPESTKTESNCLDLIKKHQLESSVTMKTDFSDDRETLQLLQAATMVVFPYQNTAESVSGAVRYGLATRRAVICTPLDIFNDIGDIIHLLPGTKIKDIVQGLDKLLSQGENVNSKLETQNRYLDEHSWDVLGRRLSGMLKGLLINKYSIE